MIVAEVLFLTLFWSWVISGLVFLRRTFLRRMPIQRIPGELRLPSETVAFPATDGVRLEGWKIPAHIKRPWIILCHGVGSNRSELLAIAARLRARRFNVFLFDFRGHGGSGGLCTSFGWQEQRDLEGALAFLGQQPEIAPRPYGLYGASMGGAVGLMVAARDDRIGAVAADNPYPSLKHALRHQLKLMSPYLTRMPFLWFVYATYRLRFGVWPRQVSPQEAAAHLNPRPLLVMDAEETALSSTKYATRLHTFFEEAMQKGGG